MTKKRIYLFIRGKVQGVFFRQAIKVVAKKNNITGWVRNLDDGRVEALLEGDSESVNTVVEWSNIGPANHALMRLKLKLKNLKMNFYLLKFCTDIF